MAFPAFLDTNVVFGQLACDVFLSLADEGTFTPYWSRRVLDAMEREVIKRRPAIADAVHRRRLAMEQSFPAAEVTGFDGLINAMTNHPGDRHVLAACVVSPAQTLVTANVKDFPPESLQPYDIEVVHPDDFLLDQFDLHPRACRRALGGMLRRFQKPPTAPQELADRLAASGLPHAAAWVRGNL